MIPKKPAPDLIRGGHRFSDVPPNVGKPRLHLGIGERRIDFPVELLNDFCWRVFRNTKAAPEACLVARQEVAQGRGIFKFTLTMAGYNLIRLPKLIAAQA